MLVSLAIRCIRESEWELYRQLRLNALLESPHAFASTFEQALKRSGESWQEQVSSSASGSERYTALVFDEGRPVGMGAVYEIAQSQAELLQMWIKPEFRSSGIGKTLVDHLECWVFDHGFTKLIATVHRENPRAITFYMNQGYQTDVEAMRTAPQRDHILFKSYKGKKEIN